MEGQSPWSGDPTRTDLGITSAALKAAVILLVSAAVLPSKFHGASWKWTGWWRASRQVIHSLRFGPNTFSWSISLVDMHHGGTSSIGNTNFRTSERSWCHPAGRAKDSLHYNQQIKSKNDSDSIWSHRAVNESIASMVAFIYAFNSLIIFKLL